MERQFVKSRSIAAAGFERNTLEVEYFNGMVYQFEDVPTEIGQGLLTACDFDQAFSEVQQNGFKHVKTASLGAVYLG